MFIQSFKKTTTHAPFSGKLLKDGQQNQAVLEKKEGRLQIRNWETQLESEAKTIPKLMIKTDPKIIVLYQDQTVATKHYTKSEASGEVSEERFLQKDEINN